MKIIRFIKNILIIVCLSFSIITSISKCNAYTFEQFEQFLNAVYDNNITSGAYNHDSAGVVLNGWQTIKNTLTSHNVDLTQYDSFAIYGNGTNWRLYDYYEVFLFQKNTWIQYGLSQSYGSSGYFDIKGQGIQVNTNGGYYVKSSNEWRNNARAGIFNKESGNMGTAVTQYRWDPNEHPLVPPFIFYPNDLIHIDDIYYVKMTWPQDVLLGNLGDNEYYELQIRVKDRYNKIIGTLFDNEYITQISDNALIRRGDSLYLNSVYLYFYNDYTLNFIVYSDSNTFVEYNYTYQFMPMNAVVENGVIIDSGDTVFGNQDLAIYLPDAIAEAVVGSSSEVTNIYDDNFGRFIW